MGWKRESQGWGAAQHKTRRKKALNELEMKKRRYREPAQKTNIAIRCGFEKLRHCRADYTAFLCMSTEWKITKERKMLYCDLLGKGKNTKQTRKSNIGDVDTAEKNKLEN